MKRVVLLSLAAVALSAQTFPGNVIIPNVLRAGVSPVLQRYLELTPEQVIRIDRLNNELRQFEVEKIRRTGQVQLEIQQETTRRELDAMALGLRYVEMEAIRRETEAQRTRTVEAVQALLTPAQKTRITALQEVLRNVTMACEALSSNLMTPPAPVAPDPNSGFASFLLGGTATSLLGYSAACPGIPAIGIRTGDFTFTPQQP